MVEWSKQCPSPGHGTMARFSVLRKQLIFDVEHIVTIGVECMVVRCIVINEKPLAAAAAYGESLGAMHLPRI